MPRGALEEAVEAVRSERVRGATWALRTILDALGRDAREGLATCERVQEITRAIRSANRSMASLWNLAWLVEEACRRGREVADAVEAFNRYLEKVREQFDAGMADYALTVRSGMKVFTLSFSSTVEYFLGKIKHAVERVYVAESQPGGEGAHMAKRLRDQGFDVVLVPDVLMSTAILKSDAVVVGADSVTLDGCLVNKVGTRQAIHIAVKFTRVSYVVFESHKIHPIARCETFDVETRSYRIEPWGELVYPVFDVVEAREYELVVGFTEQTLLRFNKRDLVKVLSTAREWMLEGIK